MTTASSPESVLRKQSDHIAAQLKRMRPDAKKTLAVGVAMDDKLIKIEILWSTVAEYSERELSDYVLGLMRRRT